MKIRAQKLLKIGKKALAVALIAALSVSAVACDLIENSNASTTETVYVTDELGNVVTDELGLPVVDNGETLPEIETEANQTVLDEELFEYTYLKSFSLNNALNGTYLETFNSKAVNVVLNRYNTDKYVNDMIHDFYRNMPEIIDYQKSAITAVNNLLQSNNKNFTLAFTMLNKPYLAFELVVNDEKEVLAITAQDIRSGNKIIVNGIVGEYYYTSPLFEGVEFITEENISQVQSYLQNHSFSELSSAIFAFLPASIHAITLKSQSMALFENEESTTVNFTAKLGEMLVLVSFGVKLNDNRDLVGFSTNSLGFNVSCENNGFEEIPIGQEIFSSTYNPGYTPQIILDALASATEQEIPAEPETENSADSN